MADKCPTCSRKIDANANMSGPDDATPEPGDFAVCIFCGAVLIFNDQLERKIAKDADIPIEIRELLARIEYARRKVRCGGA